MSSKEQKTPEGQAPEEIIMDQHEEIEAVEPEASAEQVDPRDEKIVYPFAYRAGFRDGRLVALMWFRDVVRKFGVEVIAETNVPLDPNVHQAIAMVESDDVAPGNVLGIMQKGYTLNGRTIRAAMVTVAKAKA